MKPGRQRLSPLDQGRPVVGRTRPMRRLSCSPQATPPPPAAPPARFGFRSSWFKSSIKGRFHSVARRVARGHQFQPVIHRRSRSHARVQPYFHHHARHPHPCGRQCVGRLDRVRRHHDPIAALVPGHRGRSRNKAAWRRPGGRRFPTPPPAVRRCRPRVQTGRPPAPGPWYPETPAPPRSVPPPPLHLPRPPRRPRRRPVAPANLSAPPSPAPPPRPRPPATPRAPNPFMPHPPPRASARASDTACPHRPGRPARRH